MYFRRNSAFLVFSNPCKVFERRKSVVQDDFSPRVKHVEFSHVCINSDSFLSKIPLYDCDKLEKDITTGIPLEQVNTLCMSQQSFDSIDLHEVSQRIEEKEKESVE